MFAIGLAGYLAYRSCPGDEGVRRMTSTTQLAGRQDMAANTNDQRDTAIADARDDSPDVRDPRDTDHPAGEDQAKRNQENEPAG